MRETADQRTERHLRALRAVAGALRAADAPEHIIHALDVIRFEILFDLADTLEADAVINGRKPMRLSGRLALAAFAAAVTVLKKERGVASAIADVAVPHGVDQKELKNFRDRLNRGRADRWSDYMYKLVLAKFEKKPKARIMSTLNRLRIFVPNPHR
jgi:hypothetical protein